MADPQVITQKVKSTRFSDSSSLGEPLLGAAACLDAFKEAGFLHLLKKQKTRSPEFTVLPGAESAGRGVLGCWRGECWPVLFLCPGN